MNAEAERQPSPPAALRDLQDRFGTCAREPLDFATGRMRCRPERFDPVVVGGILPRGDQPPSERLAIYNEQYWFRLLTVLQEGFPLAVRLIGYWEFNRIAMEYLHAHPSRGPFLEGLPWDFPAFLRTRRSPGLGGPDAPDARLIPCAEIDLAAFRAFHAPGMEPLDPGRMTADQAEELGRTPLRLQPWFSLVEEDWNLVEWRRKILEGIGGIPDAGPEKGCWAVFRRNAAVEWKSLPSSGFRLLRALQDGSSLEEACETVGSALADVEAKAFADGLTAWFSEWTAMGWFVRPGFNGYPGTSLLPIGTCR